ncbi:MAG TPA: hypothetical protein VL173_00700 [Vicinamibacterales bacterium]|nr:hypothetical protein [Vicinamibacterales bacterium]
MVRTETPAEYFRELVQSAMQHQHVNAQETTSFYVVNLLSTFVHFDRVPSSGEDEALGVLLVRALQTAGAAQRQGLRRVGDRSLFMSGFFSDSLNRGLIDIDYYIHLGEYAYGSLAQHSDDTLGDVFDELAGKFGAFVDVLAEVSEQSALSSNVDLLRLYERFLRTRSRRTGDLLAARGIVPNAVIASKLVQ